MIHPKQRRDCKVDRPFYWRLRASIHWPRYCSKLGNERVLSSPQIYQQSVPTRTPHACAKSRLAAGSQRPPVEALREFSLYIYFLIPPPLQPRYRMHGLSIVQIKRKIKSFYRDTKRYFCFNFAAIYRGQRERNKNWEVQCATAEGLTSCCFPIRLRSKFPNSSIDGL